MADIVTAIVTVLALVGIAAADKGKKARKEEKEPEEEGTDRSKIIVIAVVGLMIGALIVAAYFWSRNEVADEDEIVLYGFSVKGEAFDESIIPAFKEHWKKTTGKDISFKTVYAGSGKITNQVISGAPAEVMVLSTEWDALQLKKEGLVTTDWRDLPHNGTVTKSPWVIMTRNGNPKGITDFPDLTKEGVEIVHADPITSGGACWSVFAQYGSVLKKTTLDEGAPNTTAAEEHLEGMADNVISWQSSARAALTQYTLGYGDAIVTYENEALFSISEGNDFEIVYPVSTIYSEHKILLIDENVNKREREVVEAFIDFLFTKEVQGLFADYGFRSIDENINAEHPEFEPILMPFTVDYLGGWEKAHPELIDGVFKGIKDG